MAWISNIGAAILLFFGSIFGLHPAQEAAQTSPIPISPISSASSQPITPPSNTTISPTGPNPDLPQGFSVQPDGVYSNGGKIALDPQTFSVVKNSRGFLVKDKNGVYYIDSSEPKKLLDADPATFQVVKDVFGFPDYGKDSKGVYVFYDSYGWRIDHIAGADPNTFEILPGTVTSSGEGKAGVDFSRDKNHVYGDVKIIAGADPATFRNMPSFDPGLRDIGSAYNVDASHVYYAANQIEGAIPSEFKLLPTFDDALSISGNTIYLFGTKLITVDGSTFKFLAPPPPNEKLQYYGVDKNALYYFYPVDGGYTLITGGVRIIIGADPATFKILSDGTAQDKNHHYDGDTVLAQ